jgi:lipopolysaccharide export system permease protein
MRILDRYIVKEFVNPFAACVAGFTVMLLASIIFDLTNLIVHKQMPINVVLQLLVYKVPMIVVISLPIAVLFAVLLSLGRLAQDSELKMMRSIGCSYPRLILPLLMVATLVSGVTYALNEYIVPAANHRAQNLYRQAAFRDAVLQIDAHVFLQGPGGRTFYVGEVDRTNRKVHHIMIFEQLGAQSGSPYPALLTARTGTYNTGMWQLEDGVRRVFDADGYVTQEIAFSTLEVPMVQGEEQLFGEQKTTDEMTRRELGDLIRLYRRGGIELNSFIVQYHLKLALPLVALVWAMVAAPLSVAAARTGRMYGVVASIALAFIYYVVLALGQALGSGEVAIIPPVIAAWFPTVLFAAGGVFLLARADRV